MTRKRKRAEPMLRILRENRAWWGSVHVSINAVGVSDTMLAPSCSGFNTSRRRDRAHMNQGDVVRTIL
jgi:hypothetical protein